MFSPVSKLRYLPAKPDAQILVCTFSNNTVMRTHAAWCTKAAAVFKLHNREEIGWLVEDLLANPHVRALCFIEQGPLRDAVAAVWRGERPPGCRVTDEHLTLVRQFVDLFDEDCGYRVTQFSYWPEPIRYDK
jgi:hypothetical protein